MANEPVEITALKKNLEFITDTVQNSLQRFANGLVEKAFIKYEDAQGILKITGVTPATQVGRLMESVYKEIKYSDTKKELFLKFVSIFSGDTANNQLVKKLKQDGECGTS